MLSYYFVLEFLLVSLLHHGNAVLMIRSSLKTVKDVVQNIFCWCYHHSCKLSEGNKIRLPTTVFTLLGKIRQNVLAEILVRDTIAAPCFHSAC